MIFSYKNRGCTQKSEKPQKICVASSYHLKKLNMEETEIANWNFKAQFVKVFHYYILKLILK